MKAGFNKLDITPTAPVNIAGYSRKEQSKGVIDPIEINSLVIQDNHQLVIISLLDAIIIENSVIIPVKKHIANQYNIPLSNIIIGCIHTHSAPAYFKPYFEEVAVEQTLQTKLIDKFIDSIDQAVASLKEVELKISQTTIKGLYGNRNIMNSYSDKSLTLFDFYAKNQNVPSYSLISMACHPTILNGSNLKLSADLIGALRQKFKQQYNRECMVANGCCGDVSTRFYRKLSGIEELNRVSEELLMQFNNLKPIEIKTSTIKSTSISDTYTLDARIQQFSQSAIKKLTKTIENATNQNEIMLAKMLLKNLKIKEERSPMTLTLTSNIICIGDLIIISLPGDITSILGKRIKDAFKDHLVILIGYCENYSNYFVAKEEYGLYFETYISRLDIGKADQFFDHIIDATKKLLI